MDPNAISRMISLAALAGDGMLSLPLVARIFRRAAPGIRSLRAFPRPSRGRCSCSPALRCCSPVASCGSRSARRRCSAAPRSLPSLARRSCPAWPVNAAFQPKDESAPVYRLLQLNLRFDNPAPEKVLSLIGRVQPDVITLNEVSAMWSRSLHLIATATLSCRLRSTAGRRRRDPVAAAVRFGRDAAMPRRGTFAIATVDLGGRRVEVGRFICIGPGRSSRQRRSTRRAPLGRARPKRRCSPATSMPPPGAPRPADRSRAGGLRHIARHRADLALSQAARCAAAVCRPADRPGFRQGRYRGPSGEDARGRRLRPSSGAGRILAAGRRGARRRHEQCDSDRRWSSESPHRAAIRSLALAEQRSTSPRRCRLRACSTLSNSTCRASYLA